MDKERTLLLNAISEGKSELESIFKAVLKSQKSEEASEVARKKGNALLLQQKKHDPMTHEKIFNHYCESIALAPIESETLALAYGNRSYLLSHIGKYEDCIRDIDYALKITASDVLKAKLLCRKIQCLKKLGSTQTSSILEMVTKLIDKIDNDQDKTKLVQMIYTVKSLVISDREEERNNKQKVHIKDVPLTKDYMSRVKIQHNEEYGRHLIAARDYKPGDIIIVEKTYASSVSDRLNAHCHYCLKPVWSSVPCNYCNWTMFCDESCREKAWNDFHDIECSLISHLKSMPFDRLDTLWINYVHRLRVWIAGMKEAGNIANLKRKLEFVDECKDHTSRGFFEKGKFVINSIQNIHSLHFDLDDDSIIAVSIIVSRVLILFNKYSQTASDQLDINNIEDLTMNEDLLFLGSLLIRIFRVCSLNCFSYDSCVIECEKLESDIAEVGMLGTRFITTLSSLCNHSCFPTAGWRYVEPNKFLMFAMQSIKKNSQIFISYGRPFYSEDKTTRHMLLREYNFVCKCHACIEAWQPIISLADQLKHVDNNDSAKICKLMQQTCEIICQALKEGQIEEEHLKKLSLSIVKASSMKQPSLSYCALLQLLNVVFEFLYCPELRSFYQCD